MYEFRIITTPEIPECWYFNEGKVYNLWEKKRISKVGLFFRQPSYKPQPNVITKITPYAAPTHHNIRILPQDGTQAVHHFFPFVV